MNSTAIASLRSVALAGLLALSGAASASDADRLAQSVHDRPAGRDLSTSGRMELQEKGRASRIRQLVTYRLDRGDGDTATLVRFLGPQDIAGTAVLSNNRADGTTEQWLYLPELDRVRRVGGERKGGRFAGSELYFEDLQQRKPSLDRHRLLGEEPCGSTTCQVLESIPLTAGNSVYRKRVSWVDPRTHVVHRVDYFEKSETEPSKRWVVDAVKQVQGYWTITDSRMIDLGSGRETRLVVEAAKYDRKLPAGLFTTQALADEQLESEHRP